MEHLWKCLRSTLEIKKSRPRRTGLVSHFLGQTGADFAALHAGKMLGIPTGGYAAKGWLIQDFHGIDKPWPNLAAYELKECQQPGYPPRTMANVTVSDLVVWFGLESTPGGRLTMKTARKQGKEILINPTLDELVAAIGKRSSVVLDVAGNRFNNKAPIIYQRTFLFLAKALLRLGYSDTGWQPPKEEITLNQGRTPNLAIYNLDKLDEVTLSGAGSALG